MGKVHELGRYQAWWWSPGGTDSLDRKDLMSVYHFAVRSHGLSGVRWRYYQHGRLKDSLRTKAFERFSGPGPQGPVVSLLVSCSFLPLPLCLSLLLVSRSLGAAGLLHALRFCLPEIAPLLFTGMLDSHLCPSLSFKNRWFL